MNLPNILTLLRVLLIPLFVILIINKHLDWALLTFAIAGITDGLDGLIARLTHQRTELGAYLDPIADKLLLFAGFISLAIIEVIPSWLVVIVIARDVIILMGFLVMYPHRISSQDQPQPLEQDDHDFPDCDDPIRIDGVVLPSLQTSFRGRHLRNRHHYDPIRNPVHLYRHSNFK